MKFLQGKSLKPIVEGKIGNNQARMLVDSGADYIVLTVPKYQPCKDINGKYIKDEFGRYKKEKKYLDAQYDKLIREEYGPFVKKADGSFVKVTIHGFGDTSVECRVITLKSFSIGDFEFTDNYVLLDEEGFALNQDMIIGTACLRNFVVSIDYSEKNIEFEQKTKELAVNYTGITSSDTNLINGSVLFPLDVYMLE